MRWKLYGGTGAGEWIIWEATDGSSAFGVVRYMDYEIRGGNTQVGTEAPANWSALNGHSAPPDVQEATDTAIAYRVLTGTHEGFPEQEFDL
jgi:hypothetical protein